MLYLILLVGKHELKLLVIQISEDSKDKLTPLAFRVQILSVQGALSFPTYFPNLSRWQWEDIMLKNMGSGASQTGHI